MHCGSFQLLLLLYFKWSGAMYSCDLLCNDIFTLLHQKNCRVGWGIFELSCLSVCLSMFMLTVFFVQLRMDLFYLPHMTTHTRRCIMCNDFSFITLMLIVTGLIVIISSSYCFLCWIYHIQWHHYSIVLILHIFHRDLWWYNKCPLQIAIVLIDSVMSLLTVFMQSVIE